MFQRRQKSGNDGNVFSVNGSGDTITSTLQINNIVISTLNDDSDDNYKSIINMYSSSDAYQLFISALNNYKKHNINNLQKKYQNYKILREQQRQHDAEIIKEVFQKHDQRVANCDERYYHWCLSQSMIQLGKELKQASPN